MIEENAADNTQCTSESHDRHLCYLMSQGFHLSDKQEYDALTDDPEFQCGRCGRKANRDQNLCVPVAMETA